MLPGPTAALRQLRPEQIEQIVSLRRGGMTIIALAIQFERSLDGIKYWLRKRGVLAEERAHKVKLTPEEKRLKRNEYQRLFDWRKKHNIAPPPRTYRGEVVLKPLKDPPKYQHLIDDECLLLNRGSDYAEIRARNAARRKPAREARMVKFRAEYNERVKRRGRLVTVADKKIIDTMFGETTRGWRKKKVYI